MRPVYIMATPEEGGDVVFGTASDVCVHLWGRPPGSRYPRYITNTLRAAREGTPYRGYTFQVLPGKPVMATWAAMVLGTETKEGVTTGMVA